MHSAFKPAFQTPAFEAWNASLAIAANAIGARGFPDALSAALRLLAPFQMMNGFIYSPDGHAFDLYNEKIVAERAIIVDRYLAGAFVLDPFYDAARNDGSERLLVMRDIAPDDFSHSEYYRQHYATTAIIDEIGRPAARKRLHGCPVAVAHWHRAGVLGGRSGTTESRLPDSLRFR